MRTLCSILLVLIVAFGCINLAEAKRFGGGRSFGVQRSMSSFGKSNAFQPASMVRRTASSWLAPLVGLVSGGLLAYFLMGHGIGTGILSWLLLAGALVVLGRMLFSRTQMANSTLSYPARDINQPSPSAYANMTPSETVSIAGFDEQAFLREMKSQFIRLQAAYDEKNLRDIREYTTPEVFAEVQLQIQERGNDANFTEVLELNAQLLSAQSMAYGDTADVKFTGMIREEKHAEATPFTEVWHFTKDHNRWLIAGIQQN